MIKKVTIGIRPQYLLPAVIAAAVGAVAMFLPLVSAEGESASYFAAMSKSFAGGVSFGWMLPVIVVSALAGLAFGIVSLIAPKKALVRCMIACLAVAAAAETGMFIAAKHLTDGLGLLPTPFMAKMFGLGFWLAIVAAYVSLVLSMKTAIMNTGYIVLVILSIIWLFPIAWITLTALRKEPGYYVGYFIPKGFTLDNFKNLFKPENQSVLPFSRWYLNTLFVATAGCLINTVIVLATAYTLSRTRFKGRTTFMKILLVIGMFPGFMSMLAVYNILKGLGLNQSLMALVIVGAAGAAMGYHVCKGFLDTIPRALDEAAIIDGASRWRIFTRIAIPLSKPIAIYTLLTNFLGAWSDYIFPSMLFGDQQSNYTVAIGLYWMTDFRRIDSYYTQFAAGALVVALPIMILFICLQRFYVEGLSGAVKG